MESKAIRRCSMAESKTIRFRQSNEKPMLGGFFRFNKRKEMYHIEVSFENEEPFIEGSIYNTSDLSKFLKTYIDDGSNNCTSDTVLGDIFNIISKGCISAVIKPAGFEFTITLRRINNDGD